MYRAANEVGGWNVAVLSQNGYRATYSECMWTRPRHETIRDGEGEYTEAKGIVKGEMKTLTVDPIRQHDSNGDHDLE